MNTYRVGYITLSCNQELGKVTGVSSSMVNHTEHVVVQAEDIQAAMASVIAGCPGEQFYQSKLFYEPYDEDGELFEAGELYVVISADLIADQYTPKGE